MKHIIFLIILFLLLLAQSCQSLASKSNESTDNQSVRTDTILIEDEKISIFIIPTNEELNRLQSKYNSEEDFYISSDDAAYYSAKADLLLKKENINIANIDTTCAVINFSNSYYINLSDTTNIHNPLFDIILYQKGHQPLISSSIDIENDVYEYFGLKNTAKNIHDILPIGNGQGVKDSKWVGVYQIDIGYDEDNGNAFTVTLKITSDSVIFEAEGHTLSNEYQLSVIEEKANCIKLAYYKQIDDQYSLYALRKTTDFGLLEFHNGKYIWKHMKYLTVITGETLEYIINREESIN